MNSFKILYVLWLLLGLHSCCEESSLPTSIKQWCQCTKGSELTCQGLESTKVLQVLDNDIYNPYDTTVALHITKSEKLQCLDPSHLRGFAQLRTFSVTFSGLKTLICAHSKGQFEAPLSSLNLKNNSLTQVKTQDFSALHKSLTELNLSQNFIGYIPGRFFEKMTVLRKLDLSNNKLNEDLKPNVFLTLPPSLQSLDISNNTWACSSQLAWMHIWRSRRDRVELENMDDVRCIHERSTFPLFLVMKYYDEFVNPQCPNDKGCSCRISYIFETSQKQDYIVHVSCKGQDLHHFPDLPERTQAVDLSDNKLNDEAFKDLDVKKKHYDRVEDLTLDGNQLEKLENTQILDIPLGMRFSARNNKLTSIPFDLSQHFIKNTDSLLLSQNPWRCTCDSEINNLNLLQKVEENDKKQLSCGSQSDSDLVNTKIVEINPEVLCPPTSSGEYQEILLRILCVFLALMTILVIAKLIYDVQMYRRHGQLPWLATKMY